MGSSGAAAPSLSDYRGSLEMEKDGRVVTHLIEVKLSPAWERLEEDGVRSG